MPRSNGRGIRPNGHREWIVGAEKRDSCVATPKVVSVCRLSALRFSLVTPAQAPLVMKTQVTRPSRRCFGDFVEYTDLVILMCQQEERRQEISSL